MIDIRGISPHEPVKIIIGAGGQHWPGWIPTDKEDLNLLNAEDWKKSFQHRLADAFLCEYVWEHLTAEEGREAAAYCFKYLKPGGYLRCAVPDGFFPYEYYRKIIGDGGLGESSPPSGNHKVVYNYRRLSEVFIQAGFEVDLLEYCDEQGRLHYRQWSTDDGPVYRSLMLDWRNQNGKIVNASLIIDAKKPAVAKTSPSRRRLISFYNIRKTHRGSFGTLTPA